MYTKEQLLGKARVKILVGEFGSGKTELAVNYALALQNAGLPAAIVDIDLVKPYFRAREVRGCLEQRQVKVVAPDSRLSNADLPVMPPELHRLLGEQNYQVVMDVGGGESSIVLGQFNAEINAAGYQALLVVNTKRPFTSDAAGIETIIHAVERASRLKVSGLVSNTNLAGETTAEHVLAGLEKVREVSRHTGLPVEWVVVPDWLAGKVPTEEPQFVLTPRTQYPWMMD